ncbi:unnamed protein product [Prorocentrum cordatum]|uniref:Rhodanese domain-containing protein n=1 Tax=Prorocentrum cordatum TaxID=2364126 RepID=A0ABN9TVG3_9DINO|nr:unnamed protein product [Polarella glacialis]
MGLPLRAPDSARKGCFWGVGAPQRQRTEGHSGHPYVERISPHVAAALVEHGGALLLDVRTPEQVQAMTDGQTIAAYSTGAGVTGADVSPLDEWVAAGFPPEGTSDRKVVVSCTAGPKSMLAWEFLREHGVDAFVVDGGFNAWSAAGLPTTRAGESGEKPSDSGGSSPAADGSVREVLLR